MGWFTGAGGGRNVITTATSGNLISKSANPYIRVILLEPLPVLFLNTSSEIRKKPKFDMYSKVTGNGDHFMFGPTLAYKLHEIFYILVKSDIKLDKDLLRFYDISLLCIFNRK